MSARESLPFGAPVLIACGQKEAAAPPPAVEIGFKAHNLARMAALGLPVPPAFVLGTQWCRSDAAPIDPALWTPGLQALELAAGERFGDPRRPLLLSVRSGAPVSMPGMMDTLLNIGLADDTVGGFLRATGNPRLVWDSYRRLVSGYGEIVMGIDAAAFEADLVALGTGRDERDLDYAELRTLTRMHQATCQREAGRGFPQQVHEQLAAAIRAVYASWNADKAREYRRQHALPDTLGTAVTVQRMVFGNAGGLSGAGVGFTRHPSTGEREPWIDFLFNAQGEDVVSGRRSARGHDELAAAAPLAWSELQTAMSTLEAAFCDMQDFEFTLEKGHLWLLQTREGKRTPQARARVALDLFDEGLIERDEALRRTANLDAAALTTREIAAADGQAPMPLAHGVGAAHGIAVGEIVLDEARARSRAGAAGAAMVLVTQDAQTRDIAALELVSGLLTARGARTSHAAVVARQMGKVCLVGCEALEIDLQRRCITLGGVELAEGQVITLDGHHGVIYRDAMRTVEVQPLALLARLDQLRSAPMAGTAERTRPQRSALPSR